MPTMRALTATQATLATPAGDATMSRSVMSTPRRYTSPAPIAD